jgi:hypothetical protein
MLVRHRSRARAVSRWSGGIPYVVSYARLAPGVLNSPSDVEAALREIRAMA